jgi:hypothetical protein
MLDAFLKKEKKRHPRSAGRCGHTGARAYIYIIPRKIDKETRRWWWLNNSHEACLRLSTFQA